MEKKKDIGHIVTVAMAKSIEDSYYAEGYTRAIVLAKCYGIVPMDNSLSRADIWKQESLLEKSKQVISSISTITNKSPTVEIPDWASIKFGKLHIYAAIHNSKHCDAYTEGATWSIVLFHDQADSVPSLNSIDGGASAEDLIRNKMTNDIAKLVSLKTMSEEDFIKLEDAFARGEA